MKEAAVFIAGACRCPTCLAMLLSQDDLDGHMEWHRSTATHPRDFQAENERIDSQFNEVAKRAEDYFSGMCRRDTWWIGI